MQAQLKGAFDTIADVPVPERLRAAVRPPQAEVIDFGAAERARESRRWGSLPQWAAMAATLAVGIFVGTVIPQRGSAPVEVQGGRTVRGCGAQRRARFAARQRAGGRHPHSAHLPRSGRRRLPHLYAADSRAASPAVKAAAGSCGPVRRAGRARRQLPHGRGHGPEPRRAGRLDHVGRAVRCRGGEEAREKGWK